MPADLNAAATLDADPEGAADYLRSRWDEAAAPDDPVDRLVYRSNLLGEDARITNTGGGNTSSKVEMPDPVTGETATVLWVKGSGGDLRTAKRANFASLYQDRLMALQDVYASKPERGPKTPAEDEMVAMYPHTTFDLNPRAPSIDTPLHAYIPYKHVDHMHPVAVIALATAADGEALTREVYGDEVVWTDWQRPGFELGLELQRICREHPDAKGVVLGGHGLINWADDDRACYELTLDLIRRAQDFLDARANGQPDFGGQKTGPLAEAERRAVLDEVLPWLRGRVSGEKRMIGTVQATDEVLEFVGSHDAPRLAELGTSCPDHFLRTKIKPLYVDWQPDEGADALKQKLDDGLRQYVEDYGAYYEQHKHDDSPALRPSSPSVVLIPGVGLVAWGKSKSESRVTAEFYTAAIGVMRGAERVSSYTALPRQEAFDIEYWLLEEAKLQRMPPEKALARQVAVVVGAGSGIGREVVDHLVGEGAVVACVDLDAGTARETAEAVMDRVGMGIGVAGSGLSGSGDVVGLGADMTKRAAVREMVSDVVFAYGGLDHVVVTAGYYPTPDENGEVSDGQWATAFAVNVSGPYVVLDEARRVWEAQELDGSAVVTTSVNAVVPKAGSFAYDTSKAAANHLVRELAVALAPRVRVNGVAPATVVEGSSMFPRDRVKASLTKYGIDFADGDSTEDLRAKLAKFYAARTLTDQPITPDDQAEAILALVTGMHKTTGQILSVDGGLRDAFLR
jgi:rhamnulose-1-phosphate aldolase/alcohol dehydrogenase